MNFDVLRRAGATARAMLVAAAANSLERAGHRAPHRKERGEPREGGRSATYGELAAAAASDPCPSAAGYAEAEGRVPLAR